MFFFSFILNVIFIILFFICYFVYVKLNTKNLLINKELKQNKLNVETINIKYFEILKENNILQFKLKFISNELENKNTVEYNLNNKLQQKELEIRNLISEISYLKQELKEKYNNSNEFLTYLNKTKDTLYVQFTELSNKIFEDQSKYIQENTTNSLKLLLNPLQKDIKSFEKRVEESYTQEARERFALSKELERLQQLNVKLGEESQNLTQALQGNKNQGIWGELVLDRILEQSGLEKGREYNNQVSLKTAESDETYLKPDVIIYLPENKNIVIDSKVSLNSYQKYLIADNKSIKQYELKKHVISLRKHIKKLSGKNYNRLKELYSLDFVLLFIPIEAALIACVQIEPNLLQEAFSENIIIVTPSTLLVTLRIINSLWRNEKQSRHAQDIAESAGFLYDKFVSFVYDLDEIGKRIRQVEHVYTAACNKLNTGKGNLIKRSEKLKLLGANASKKFPLDWVEKSNS